MKSRNLIRLILGVVVFIPLARLGISKRADAVSCGPGPHWVDTTTSCPSGTDEFSSQTNHGVVIFDLEDGGLIIPLPLTGATVVFLGGGTTTPDHHIQDR